MSAGGLDSTSAGTSPGGSSTGRGGALDFNGQPEDSFTPWYALDPVEDPTTGEVVSDGGRMAAECMRRVQMYYDFTQASGLWERSKRSYLTRYGLSPDGDNVSYRVVRGGSNGQLALFQPNHYANTLTHMSTLITASKPDILCKAANSDPDSLRQVRLADQVCQDVERRKHVPDMGREMVDLALLMGEAWSWCRWDASAGDDFMPDEGGKMMKTGDVDISIHFWYDVIRDVTALTQRGSQWRIVRDWQPKADVMARFPEHKDIIAAVQKPQVDAFRIEFQTGISESELIPVYQAYFPKTEAMPRGRQCTFVSSDCLLLDGDLKYGGRVPVIPIMPAKILGTPFGYTPGWDMLSLQQILNALYSGMVTNAVTWAVRRMLTPQGQELSAKQISENLVNLKYNPNLPKPEMLETPLNTAEILQGIAAIERLFGLFSSISDVQRGQLPVGKESMSGSAMMLLVNQSLQFMSGLQASYVEWYEELFDLIIVILKERATAPMFLAVAGDAEKATLETFTRNDLQSVRRVTAEMANPLQNQYAGQQQMMDTFLQLGAFGQGPEAGRKALQVYQTGNFKALAANVNKLPELIQKENELLKQGILPPVNKYDIHDAHTEPNDGHPSIVNDFEARQNPKAQVALEAHMAMHEAAKASLVAEMAHAAAQSQAAGAMAAAAVLGPPAPPPGAPQPPHGVAPTRPGVPHPGKSPATAPPTQGQAGPNPRLPQMPAMPAGGGSPQ